MPDVKDAMEAVTDPANVHVSDSHSGMRRVKEKKVMSVLRGGGAGKAEARLLITEAVQELDGLVESEVRTGGRPSGPDTKKAGEIWFVPADAVRKY